MKLRHFLFTALVSGVSFTAISDSAASSQLMLNRVRTVPKESKDTKDQKKKEESKASTPQTLTPSTASLIYPVATPKSPAKARTCSQTEEDCEKLLAQGELRR